MTNPPIWARTRTIGALWSTALRTRGVGPWARVTVSRTGTTTVRRTGFRCAVCRTDYLIYPVRYEIISWGEFDYLTIWGMGRSLPR